MISQSDVTFDSVRRGNKKNQIMLLEIIMAENASRQIFLAQQETLSKKQNKMGYEKDRRLDVIGESWYTLGQI